jgi:hypothetical protein
LPASGASYAATGRRRCSRADAGHVAGAMALTGAGGNLGNSLLDRALQLPARAAQAAAYVTSPSGTGTHLSAGLGGAAPRATESGLRQSAVVGSTDQHRPFVSVRPLRQ